MPRLGNYEWDEADWDRIATSAGIVDACVSEAEEGLLYADAIAPERTGDYRSHWKVEPTTVRLPKYGIRGAAELSNDSGHAVSLEFGTAPRVDEDSTHPGMRAQRILGETAAYLGGDP